MAERWQQWMPFHIDRFRGSPDVQAMHPVARIGYLYLLASAWQTDDCTLPEDALELATLSGLGDDLWEKYSPRILRKFEAIEDGRLRNQVLFEEWSEAKRVFEKNHGPKMTTDELSARRSEAGKAGARSRWKKDGNLPQSDSKPIAKLHEPIANQWQNDGLQMTGTGTNTGTEKPSTLALTSAEVPAAGVFELPLPGKQGEWQVPEDLYREMVRGYPDIRVMEELAKMRAWLLTNHRKTPKGLPRFINNWLSRAQDDIGRRGGNGNGNSNGRANPDDKAERNRETAQRVLAAEARRQNADQAESCAGGNRSLDTAGGVPGQGPPEGQRPAGAPGGHGGDDRGAMRAGDQPGRGDQQLLPDAGGAAAARYRF